MGPTAEIIRIVLVSPNDVEAEWRYARKAIDEVDAYNAKPRGHRLELYTWKTDAYPGWHLEGPQGLIDALLPIETCDLVIGIFLKRMGTLTPEGTTGTEHEILKAYKASKNQGGHPQLMVYFSSASFSPKSKEEIDQWGRVLDFKTTLEKAKILLWSYKKKEFEADLRKHLSTYLNHRIGGTPVQPVETSKEARTETSRDRALTRSTIPSVTVGTEVKAGSASSVAFSPQASLKPEKVSRGDLMIVTNTRLESPGRNDTASHVGVPSVAMNGRVVFYTGNWYAALSQDGGHEFSYIDPNLLAQPDDQKYSRSFCCNQVVTYLPSIDTFVWLLQYGPSTGNNIHRVAFAKTEELLRNQWRLFDISPQMLGVPDAYLSFPDLAAGANFLYVTTNIFIDISAGEVGAAVLRIPFSSIAKGEPSLERFVSTKLFSFRVAQNCRETAFFAAHQDTSTLTIFSWPESED